MSENGVSIVLETIAKALDLPADRLNEDSSMQNLPVWDSLGHLNILVALDKHYFGRIAKISELAKATSVREIAAILQRHGLL